MADAAGRELGGAEEGLDALETFVAPAVLEATRVVCLAPPRQVRVIVVLVLSITIIIIPRAAVERSQRRDFTPRGQRPGHFSTLGERLEPASRV